MVCKMASQRPNSGINLLGKSIEELRAFTESLGEPSYRGAQIYHALYAERRFDIAAMTNLPAPLRERLTREAAITLPQILRRYRSSDGTVRYVLTLPTPTTFIGGDAPRPATIETQFNLVRAYLQAGKTTAAGGPMRQSQPQESARLRQSSGLAR